MMNKQRNAVWWLQDAWEYSALPAPVQPDDPIVPLDVVAQTVALLGDQAIAGVIMGDQRGTPVYRQTRFYRHLSKGWLPGPPDATMWGAERSLETSYFVYHFRQNDALAVIAVAPQMDALHNTLWGNFGLPIVPTSEKLFIDISVTQPPGRATAFDAANQVSISSPALYLAPVDLTDAELLAQSIALPLLAHGVAQARVHHAIGWSQQPVLSGLYLWQMWDLALPLAGWREDIVKWLYLDLPGADPEQAVATPARYRALCASHRLWMLSPAWIGIPLLCTGEDGEALHFATWGPRDPLLRLDQIALSLPSHEYVEQTGSSYIAHPGQTIALATLIEYAVNTYGRERLPVLLASLGQYDSWDTLLPAVYGVSAAEFEAGWQAYLAAHYGVSVAHKSGTQ
jgi:hypothetical protein